MEDTGTDDILALSIAVLSLGRHPYRQLFA